MTDYSKSVLPGKDFDFDEWMTLNQEDPEAFEQRRREMIDQLIQSAPQQHQRRLRGLDFQVSMERRRAQTPMDSCIRLSRLMWESFADLRTTFYSTMNYTPAPSSESAAVLEFPSG